MIAAIQTQDWMLVAVLVGVSVMVALALSSLYYAHRVYEIRSECVEDLQKMNQEIIDSRAAVREVHIKSQLLDAIPVSRLIDTDTEETQ